jgi:hypothetical protein
MRTPEQISKIKLHVDDPRSIKNFISQEEIDYLIALYENADDLSDPYMGKIKKDTGPVTLDIRPLLNDSVIGAIMDRLQSLIGKFEMTAGLFFKTDYPHIIHNDDTFELPDGVYKGITIPLKVYGSNQTPKLCFFDQFYFHGPAKFFNGSKDIPTYYNKQVYDYRDVDGLSDGMLIDESTRSKYLTHLKPEWLKGLTLWGTLDWQPNNILVFDSTRLHCASDFRQQQIKNKLGISIFTKK